MNVWSLDARLGHLIRRAMRSAEGVWELLEFEEEVTIYLLLGGAFNSTPPEIRAWQRIVRILAEFGAPELRSHWDRWM